MAVNRLQQAGDNVRDYDTDSEDYWLVVARDAYETSNTWFEANIRPEAEISMAHFQNKHAPGSKYYSAQYKHRHKGFRPKTRSMVRKKEAAAAVALFSTSDVVSIDAERAKDKASQVSASINQELLQYRLDNTIPWFVTAIGAYQDTLVSGVCISHQTWSYKEFKPEEGPPIVLRDTCTVELRPLENIRFSAAADWTDPIRTTPFLIDVIPMTIDEVKEMADTESPSKVKWVELDDATLMKGLASDDISLSRSRDNGRTNPTDERYVHLGFRTVHVHRNIIHKDGRDWIYYTLGIHERLSDPIPLEEEYPHLKPGERPYVLGISNIEAHKNYPASTTGLSARTQQEANEINNQRRDNVALVLNRRYIVNKNSQIDWSGLQRNVPGGVTEVNDIHNDVRIEAPPDVTASSYQEQDRLNMDFDELTGHFSSSSVGSNRQLNETVGGMNLLSSSADELTEYPLRVFVETWVKPVLKQLIRLEQRHESNKALLMLMGEKLELWQKYGIDDVTDAWIQGSMNVQVNVGFGATNPQQRVEKITMGLNTIIGFAPDMQAKLDGEEVAAEVLGALGYSSTERFFPKDDENQPQGPQQEPMTAFEQAKLDLERQKLELTGQQVEAKLQDSDLQRQHELNISYMKQEEMLYKLADDKQITMEQLKLEREKLATERQNKVDEMKIKLKMGTGI